MNKNINIESKINIHNIINKVLKNNPKSSCEFNLLTLYYVVDYLINDTIKKLSITKIQNAGKIKIKKNILKKYQTKKKIIKKYKTKKLRTKQHGGFNQLLIYFFMSFFIIFVKGVKNMTDIDVIKRIKQTNDVAILFKNDYGTCALNMLLFLKSINLQTFEELSLQIMKRETEGLANWEITNYLNGGLDFFSGWFNFYVDGKTLDENIEAYIYIITNKLISLRETYKFGKNDSILTAMIYVKKHTNIEHAVIIWLNSNNEITIIEPQKFIIYDIVLYSSDINMFKEQTFKILPIKDYIKENIDITNEEVGTYIFTSLHIELYDRFKVNELSPENDRLIETISKIKELDLQLGDETNIQNEREL